MRIACGYLLQESNTFSPEATHLSDFRLTTGKAVLDRWSNRNTEIAGFDDTLGSGLLTLFGGWAMTSGRIAAGDGFREMTKILQRVVCDDCDGAIIQMIRGVIGHGVPLIMTLDLHANVTSRMVAGATPILGYKTYPHVDMRKIGVAAAELMQATVRHDVHPVMAMRKLPMILPAENMQDPGPPCR